MSNVNKVKLAVDFNILFFQTQALSKMKAVTELLQLIDRVLLTVSGVVSTNGNVKKVNLKAYYDLFNL